LWGARRACVRPLLPAACGRALTRCRRVFLHAACAHAGRYQKRKYVWKMLYIYVLGYEVDFGHMEALNLITTQGYAEKTVGYLACVLLLSETNEFLRLVINSVKNDLNSHNDEIQVRSPASGPPAVRCLSCSGPPPHHPSLTLAAVIGARARMRRVWRWHAWPMWAGVNSRRHWHQVCPWRAFAYP